MTDAPEKIRCDACPVMCYIAPGQTGACDRYANDAGRIVRTDPVILLSHTVEQGGRVVPFAARDWDGSPVPADAFVTGIGSGTIERCQGRFHISACNQSVTRQRSQAGALANLVGRDIVARIQE